jgi:hypothetical protein
MGRVDPIMGSTTTACHAADHGNRPGKFGRQARGDCCQALPGISAGLGGGGACASSAEAEKSARSGVIKLSEPDIQTA